jgi:hypothetical protein
MKNGSVESHSRFGEIVVHSIRERRDASVLDNPEKTTRLLAALKAALPFEVELTPLLIAHLQAHHRAAAVTRRQIVSEISYAGDEGGIVCHIAPEDGRRAIIVSLTHVRMRRSLPLAASVFDYQKHRAKKLKKQSSA